MRRIESVSRKQTILGGETSRQGLGKLCAYWTSEVDEWGQGAGPDRSINADYRASSKACWTVDLLERLPSANPKLRRHFGVRCGIAMEEGKSPGLSMNPAIDSRKGNVLSNGHVGGRSVAEMASDFWLIRASWLGVKLCRPRHRTRPLLSGEDSVCARTSAAERRRPSCCCLILPLINQGSDTLHRPAKLPQWLAVWLTRTYHHDGSNIAVKQARL